MARGTLTGALAVLALSGCGGAGGATHAATTTVTAAPAPATTSPPVTTTAAAPGGTTGARVPASPATPGGASTHTVASAGSARGAVGRAGDSGAVGAPTPRRPGIPAGAYAGAGGPIPAGATPVRTVHGSQYSSPQGVLVSPSGNIGCDLGGDGGGCGVSSMLDSKLLGDTPVGPNWWYYFDPKGGQVGSKGDVPNYTGGNGGPQGQVVPYGQVVYFQQFVCASAANGMTCWDSRTGHGVFMNKKQMSTF